jgi:hypothetical protein
MVEARTDKILSVPAARAFEEATDLTRADWLPAVRRLRHIGGPVRGIGARYEAEVDVPGHRLHGVLVCQELDAPRRAVYELESGLDLAIVVSVQPADQSCRVELYIRYTIGGFAGRAMELATIGPARQGIVRALDTLAGRLQAPGQAAGS